MPASEPSPYLAAFSDFKFANASLLLSQTAKKPAKNMVAG